ncbi:unnamed protein product [Amoebophrya sp. A25]|nr:unnamed protein product [Amoebophrya sp. A25]|eukprot:GSA25T00015759001.1
MGGLGRVADMMHHGVEKLFAPEVAAYNWVSGKMHKLFDNSVRTQNENVGQASGQQVDYHNLKEGEYRFVDYFASACPHCTDLTPKWQAAEEQWRAIQEANPSLKLVWEQKQCLDEAWKPGNDFDACSKESVHAFPTIKFFGPKGEVADFEGPRGTDQLVQFAKQHTGLEPLPVEGASVVPTEHVTPAENQIVEYYAAACPHCVRMKPIFDEATQKWTVDHAGEKVNWVQKECLDDKWEPAKDFKDCMKEEIQGFPTVRFESKTGVVHDFEGNRTAQDLEKFVESELKQLPADETVAADSKVIATSAHGKEAAFGGAGPTEELGEKEFQADDLVKLEKQADPSVTDASADHHDNAVQDHEKLAPSPSDLDGELKQMQQLRADLDGLKKQMGSLEKLDKNDMMNLDHDKAGQDHQHLADGKKFFDDVDDDLDLEDDFDQDETASATATPPAPPSALATAGKEAEIEAVKTAGVGPEWFVAGLSAFASSLRNAGAPPTPTKVNLASPLAAVCQGRSAFL